jgi:hypothetical protein
MRRSWMILLALLILPATELCGQTRETLAPGDTVRIRENDRFRMYTVVESSGAALTLRPGQGEQIHVPVSAIEHLELRVGGKSRFAGAWKGVWMGALIGAVPGALLGFASGDDPPGWFALTAEEKAILLGITFGTAGSVVGGTVGAINPGSRWQRVTPGTRLGIAPSGMNGAALVVSRSF